jgi:hypothetical protein
MEKSFETISVAGAFPHLATPEVSGSCSQDLALILPLE